MLFTVRPADFVKAIDVVACFLEHDGQFVVLQRAAVESNPHTWGLPAGKVEEGETLAEAMLREVYEETGVRVPRSALRFFDSRFVRHGDRDFEYHMYAATLDLRPSITLDDNEHQDYRWVSPEGAKDLDLIPDLAECVDLYYHA